MAFEKAKVLKAAEKFLSQGNINAAIKEYRQIVEHDQSDFTTLNMLGDLCVRAGKRKKLFPASQASPNGIANRSSRSKPSRCTRRSTARSPQPQIAEKLAQLYSNQGLVVDARPVHGSG